MTYISFDEFERSFYGSRSSEAGWVDPGPDARAALREAGFAADVVEAGVRLWNVGAHFGFEDLVDTLRHEHGGASGAVTERSVREAVARFNGTTPLVESRTAIKVRGQVLERSSAQPVGEGRLQVCLIDAGQGSSGYYSAKVLEAAAPLFKAGTHCYLDHPGMQESQDRPERTVKDLAGVLATDAVFRDGGLWADVRVFSQFRDQIVEAAPYIGMSIRAEAEVGYQNQHGVSRTVVERITQVDSVDFVTHAGRGGRIVGAR